MYSSLGSSGLKHGSGDLIAYSKLNNIVFYEAIVNSYSWAGSALDGMTGYGCWPAAFFVLQNESFIIGLCHFSAEHIFSLGTNKLVDTSLHFQNSVHQSVF